MKTMLLSIATNKKTLSQLLIGIFLTLSMLTIFSACSTPSPIEIEGTTKFPPEVSVSIAHEQYQNGVMLLDVRTIAEWNERHVPGAILIPLDELPNRTNELNSDQDILVICRSGNRSQVGRDILINAGFKNVTSVSGGINAWAADGYPTE